MAASIRSIFVTQEGRVVYVEWKKGKKEQNQ